jgi:hypothetical protein
LYFLIPMGSQQRKRPPIGGYNHNIKYQKQLFHVQTEDSGVDNPHIFTHLFLNGMVVASLRFDYHHLEFEPEEEEASVRALMQEQHKKMLRHLWRGELDEPIATLTNESGTSKQQDAMAACSIKISAEWSSLGEALGQASEREKRSIRRGKAISEELGAVGQAVPAGISINQSPLVDEISLIEIDHLEEDPDGLDMLESTLLGLGNLAPKGSSDSLGGQVTLNETDAVPKIERRTSSYPPIPRATTRFKKAVIRSIEPVDPFGATVPKNPADKE